MVTHLSTMWETQVRSLGWEDPLEKEMAIHYSTPGKSHGQRSLVGSMGSQRVGHDWATLRVGKKIYQQKWPLWGKQKWWKTWRNSNGFRFLLSVYIKANWKPRMMNAAVAHAAKLCAISEQGQVWSCISNDGGVCLYFSTILHLFWYFLIHWSTASSTAAWAQMGRCVFL